MRKHLILKFADANNRKLITDISLKKYEAEIFNAGIIHVEMSCNYMKGHRLDTTDKQMGIQLIHDLYPELNQILEDKKNNDAAEYKFSEKI